MIHTQVQFAAEFAKINATGGWSANCPKRKGPGDSYLGKYLKDMKSFGVIILVLGIIMTTLTGFNIVTRKKVADFGSVEISKEEKTPVYWSPITGGILIVVGAVLVIAGKRKL